MSSYRVGVVASYRANRNALCSVISSSIFASSSPTFDSCFKAPSSQRGVPGSICASGGETNWNKRSGRWREARSIVQNRL